MLSRKNFSSLINKKNLIETHELAELIKTPGNYRILDSSYFVPTDGRNARELFSKERIPYSQFFDIDEISDKSTILPHMIAKEETFISYMKQMDIRVTDYIICYDRQGIFSAPRVFFNFLIYGCKNIYVLNGGYPKWISENLPTEKNSEYMVRLQGRTPPDSNSYDFKLTQGKVIDIKTILEISKNKTNQIIDCRAPPRFRGEVEEPRPTLRKGHVQSAVNVFFKDLLDSKSCFKTVEEIKNEFEKKNVNIDEEIVFYCGSGTTACVNIFAMNLLDKFENCRLYDGSWAEMVL